MFPPVARCSPLNQSAVAKGAGLWSEIMTGRRIPFNVGQAIPRDRRPGHTTNISTIVNFCVAWRIVNLLLISQLLGDHCSVKHDYWALTMYLTLYMVCMCAHMCTHAHVGHREAYFRDLVFQEATVQGQNQTERWLYQFEHDCDFYFSCFLRFFFPPELFISTSYFMFLKNWGIFGPSVQY